MNRIFEKHVLSLMPNFRLVGDHYFYIIPTYHVLCGFAWETPPSGLRILQYAFPLYDRSNEIEMTWCEPLRHPDFADVRRGNEAILADQFVKFTRPAINQIIQFQELSHLASNMEKFSALRDPRVRRPYAMTLVMLGRTAEALAQLQIIEDHPWTKQADLTFQQDIVRIRSDLSRGVDQAQATLRAWEKETRIKLGIEA